MKNITVRDLDKVIARLTTNELILLKTLIRLFEDYAEDYNLDEDEHDLTILYSNESLIYHVNKIASTKLSDYEFLKSFESLCKKGILIKDDSVSEILENYFYITINWDAVIGEAVLPDGYTGRIY